MGQNILPIITLIIARLNEWIQAFGKLDQGSQRIILVIGAVIAAIGPALVGIGSVVRAVGDISTAIGKVSTAAGKLGGMSKILGMVFNPWVIGIGLAIFAGYEIYKHWDVISQGAAQLWNTLTAVFENIKMSVSGVWENVKTATLTAWETLKDTVSSGLNSIKSFIDFKQVYKYFSEFPVIFNCRPFKYAVENDLMNIISSGTAIINPGTVESEPVMNIYGSGDIVLKVNDEQISFKDVTEKIIVNSVIQDCYDDAGNNLNGKMTGKFPKLKPGENIIEWSGDVVKAELLPNWRWL